jgi:hypothetical protein
LINAAANSTPIVTTTTITIEAITIAVIDKLLFRPDRMRESIARISPAAPQTEITNKRNMPPVMKKQDAIASMHKTSAKIAIFVHLSTVISQRNRKEKESAMNVSVLYCGVIVVLRSVVVNRVNLRS